MSIDDIIDAKGPDGLRLWANELDDVFPGSISNPLRIFAAAWEAEREQAAADRADLAAIDADLEKHMIPAEGNTVWSVHFALEQRAAARAALEQAREILALNTGIDFLDACRDLRAAVDIMHNNRHALERAKALLAEIESEARKQIANPNSNASQMVVAEAIGETCRRIANTLDNTQ